MKKVQLSLCHASGEDKYFMDSMQAAFYIQTHANIKQFNIESCFVLEKDGAFYALVKATEPARSNIASLTKNAVHDVYHESVSNNDDDQYSSGTYTKWLTTEKQRYSSNTKQIYLDDQGSVYSMGKQIAIEKMPKEYEQALPVINKAVSANVIGMHKMSIFKEQEKIRREQERLRQEEERLDEQFRTLSLKDKTA